MGIGRLFSRHPSDARLSAYLDGRLDEAARRRMSAHLKACPACQREVRDLRMTISLLQQAPLRRAPRSMALPLSVQNEQAAHRRWDMAYGALRVASVAAALACIVFLSSDFLLSRGTIPLADTAAPQPEMRMMEIEREAPAPAMEQPEAQTLADAPAVAAKAADASSEQGGIRATVVTRQAGPPAAPALARGGRGDAAPNASGPLEGGVPTQDEGGAPAVRGIGGAVEGKGGGPGPRAVVASSAAPQPTTAPDESLAVVEGDKALASVAQDDQPTNDGPTVAEAMGETPMAPPAPQALAVAQPTSTAFATAATEGALALAAPTVERLPTLEAAEDLEAPPVYGAQGRLWQTWRTARILGLTSLGAFLILLAGLLFVGQRRRI